MTLDSRHSTWATSDRFVPRVFVRPVLRFSQYEAASGILLLIAAAIALIWANSPWAEAYTTLFEETHLEISLGAFHLEESLHDLINDGLMAIFFFVVGLEIKRELVLGELREPKAAALPVMAGLGGMVLPALLYVFFTVGTGATHGWGIPMATDIAFVVGIVSLLGNRVPASGKLFVLALAIADDIGAILVIALFYTADLSFAWLLSAIVGLIAVWVANRVGIRSLVFFLPAALFVWYAMLESGVHATLAGVALGFLTPSRSQYSSQEFDGKARSILDEFPMGDTTEDEEHADHEATLLKEIATETISPLSRLEMKLLPWSSFVIVPLFALANAGVSFAGVSLGEPALARIAGGVTAGLLVGKTVGITAFTWLAVRTGIGRLPPALNWGHVTGLAAAAGIGFTVSLFVTDLAFNDPGFTDAAKVGIFAGSLLAGALGVLILTRQAETPEPQPVRASVEFRE